MMGMVVIVRVVVVVLPARGFDRPRFESLHGGMS